MSIPLVFFCALLNLALGYELAVRLGYGQAAPALRWARGNVFVITPAPLRLRLSWLTSLRDRWHALRSGRRASRLPVSTAGALAWYDVTQQWLQKLHADASAADDGLLELRGGTASEAAAATSTVLKNLALEQRASLAELESKWRTWRKHVSQATGTEIDAHFKRLRESLQSLTRQTPRSAAQPMDAALAGQLAETLAGVAACSHAVRDALWLALATADASAAPQPWRIDSLTSLATPLALRQAADELHAQGGVDVPMVAVAVKLAGVDAINRRHGTRVGDRMIRAAAMAVREMAVKAPALARVSGTTLVWFDRNRSPAEAQTAADAVCAAVAALESEADQELLHIAAQAAVVCSEGAWSFADFVPRLNGDLTQAAAR